MSFITIKQTNNKFVDVDLSFMMHPSSNDIAEKLNENAVIASIKNLCATRQYERPFHPELSSQVYDLLFEPLTHVVAATIKRTLTYVINNFEPRVNILMLDVQDSADSNSLQVILHFNIVGTVNTIKTAFLLERTL